MKMTVQKRLAAQILNCSEKKVWIDPYRLEDAKEAITKKDIAGLLKEGVIQKRNTQESSKARARHIKGQKRKGKRIGPGSKKGPFHSRLSRKDKWVLKVRAQRDLINSLKKEKKITQETYNDIYSKCSGGFFRSRRHINLYLEEHGLIKNEAK
jgi:large subunit ribosomal protein L19e